MVGSNIPTFGLRSLTLDLGLRRAFRWVFIIADVPQPVLGVDFLYHFGLLIDMRHSILSDSTTQLRVQGVTCRDHLFSGFTFSNFCLNSSQSRSHAPLIARSSTL